ncbi:MAG: histidine kinase [Lachnospiraceae bacterium]|nr:histidine kinase [Lachnospiraceae bacterium]
MKKWYSALSIRKKLMLVFVSCSFLVLAMNVLVWNNMNRMNERLDSVYGSNVSLNDLQAELESVQMNMKAYLDQKTSETMEAYYLAWSDYDTLIGELNQEVTNSDSKLMEKNIHHLSQCYLAVADDAVEAKRGRKVEQYKTSYEEATRLYMYIQTYIYSLNNEQFKNNSEQFHILSGTMHYLEYMNIIILLVLMIFEAVVVGFSSRQITAPLSQLSSAAGAVAEGNFDVPLPEAPGKDEVGSVIRAFNKMVGSVKRHIVELRQSMEVQARMREQELEMESNLKDAKLKYLQAQINPHFLFNTLNAGAQLAMIEGASMSYDYIQNMADFFRYVLKGMEEVTLRDELQLIDNYIYILNVRFDGEIHYTKQVDESLVSLKMPGMILQPIVENSVNYGIRDVEWEKRIELEVTGMDAMVCICVRDNGVGISQEKIDMIMEGRTGISSAGDSNGVGMANVKNRLELYYGREEVLSINCLGENIGTEVMLYLPADGGRENV